MKPLFLAVLTLGLTSLGCGSADHDVPVAYRRRAVPEPRLVSADARGRGRSLFVANCALCHGERGDGKGLRSEGLDRTPRDFTSVQWRSSVSPRHVFATIREGVPGSPMPGWKNLGDDEVWDLTAYVLSVAEVRR